MRSIRFKSPSSSQSWMYIKKKKKANKVKNGSKQLQRKLWKKVKKKNQKGLISCYLMIFKHTGKWCKFLTFFLTYGQNLFQCHKLQEIMHKQRKQLKFTRWGLFSVHCLLIGNLTHAFKMSKHHLYNAFRLCLCATEQLPQVEDEGEYNLQAAPISWCTSPKPIWEK